MSATSIEWTDRVWNPVRGCSRVSEGCRNCYAERIAARFSDEGAWAHGFAERTPSGPRWTGKVEPQAHKLREPLTWRKRGLVFVNSTSDLFHESLAMREIARVFAVMAFSPHLTFQVLTKRPENMALTLSDELFWDAIGYEARELAVEAGLVRAGTVTRGTDLEGNARGARWLENVWLGVSAEDQRTFEDRVRVLLDVPAAVRFLSLEPLLGPVNLRAVGLTRSGSAACRDPLRREGIRPAHRATALDWVIVGGESGPGARPCRLEWLRAAVGQCAAAHVPVFVKQLGSQPVPERGDAFAMRLCPVWDSKGGDPDEWPDDLRVRQFPREHEVRFPSWRGTRTVEE